MAKQKTYDEIIDELDKPVRKKTDEDQVDDDVKEMIGEFSKR